MHRHHHHGHHGPHFFGKHFGGRGPFGGRSGGFFERFEEMAGRGFKGGRVLSADELQLVILALLEEKPRHGYEIIKALTEKSSGIYKPSPGMIYPALTYLEDVSYAVSATEGTKKLLSITAEGRMFLEENRKHADTVLETLTRYGERVAHFQEQMRQDQDTEEKWGGSERDQMKKEWREMKSEFHEIRGELKAALFEKFAAPLEEKKRVLNVLRNAIKEIRGK